MEKKVETIGIIGYVGYILGVILRERGFRF